MRAQLWILQLSRRAACGALRLHVRLLRRPSSWLPPRPVRQAQWHDQGFFWSPSRRRWSPVRRQNGWPAGLTQRDRCSADCCSAAALTAAGCAAAGCHCWLAPWLTCPLCRALRRSAVTSVSSAANSDANVTDVLVQPHNGLHAQQQSPVTSRVTGICLLPAVPRPVALAAPHLSSICLCMRAGGCWNRPGLTRTALWVV